VLGGVPDILSSLTLGLLHDSGWYVLDYGVAKISPFGLGSGCEFVEESCIVNGETPDYSTGMFCNTEYKFENGTFLGSFGCDSTHTAMGKCDLVDYNELTDSYNPPPPGFQYFDNEFLGAYTEQKDYCPTFSMEMANCKEVPEQLEQLKLPQLDYFATAAESNEENSRCFNTDQARPICLEVKCDEVSYQVNVIVAGRNMTCDFGGQAYLIPDTNVTFFCPQLSLICPE